MFKRVKKSEDELIYYGTYQEFIDKLKRENFWQSENEFYEYMKKHTYINHSEFGEYKEDFSTKSIIIKSMGNLSNHTVIDKSSMNSEKVLLEIDSTGFSQEEINSALAETLKKLKNIQINNTSSVNKKFSLFKINK